MICFLIVIWIMCVVFSYLLCVRSSRTTAWNRSEYNLPIVFALWTYSEYTAHGAYLSEIVPIIWQVNIM